MIVALFLFVAPGCISSTSIEPATSEVNRSIDESNGGEDDNSHFIIRYYPKDATPPPPIKQKGGE